MAPHSERAPATDEDSTFHASKRTCIFCGQAANSREHVYPRWLHPYLPKSSELNHYNRKLILQRDRDDVMDTLRAGEGHSGRLKIVCDTCNNGWMSQLQVSAKPFLLPLVVGAVSPTVPLFRRQQEILSAWIAMFVMVAEHRTGDTQVIATSQATRTAFKQSRKAPPNWRIWIARYHRVRWKPLFVHSTAEVVADTHDGSYDPGRQVVPNTHATTAVFGKLFVHAFASALPRVVLKQRILDLPVEQIWPIRESPIIWPPKLTLLDEGAEKIAGSFRDRLSAIRNESFGL